MTTASRSFALFAALACALSLAPPTASSVSYQPAEIALAFDGDGTIALPLGAPVPVGATGLGPGTFLLIDLEEGAFVCTANWIWSAGAALYLGAAGHCFLSEGATASHGIGADSDVSNVRVRACVARCSLSGSIFTGMTVDLGPVAYARQTKSGIDIGNDFGLVRIPEALTDSVRTELPVWGRASVVKDVRPGDLACLYGNGVGVGEAYATKARAGLGLGTLTDGSWRAAIPSAPGDSGAALATCVATPMSTHAVGAAGILTHLSASGVAGTTMAKAQLLAREAGLTIVPEL